MDRAAEVIIMTIIRRGEEFLVGEEIEKYPAPETEELSEIGPFQLVGVYDSLVRKLFKLSQNVDNKIGRVIGKYHNVDPELGGELVKFAQEFDQHIGDIKKLLEMLVTVAKRADELDLPYQFSGTEVFSIKELRQKISKSFKDLINHAKSLIERGRGLEIIIGPAKSSVPVAGYEAAIVLKYYADTVLNDELLSEFYRTEFPLPMPGGRQETVLPLAEDIVDNKPVLDSLFSEATLQKGVSELGKAWETRRTPVTYVKTKSSLNAFRSFVRSSYRNYVFWKYADRYIEKIKELDDSDPSIFNAQLKELLQKDSSVDDILYRDLFISLLQKFTKNNIEE